MSAVAPANRKLLLLGIDGTRWDIVAEPGVGPTLQGLAAAGSWHRMTMDAPTISAPGWGTILTGATHAEHGLRDNSCVGGRTWLYPDFLAQAFYRDQRTSTLAVAGWPVLVDPSGPGPIIHPRLDQQYAGLHRVIVRDGETYGYERADAEVADVLCAFVARGGFDVGFGYFCGVDEAGHLYGLGDRHYRTAITQVDALVGRVIDAIQHRHAALGEQWLVVLATDHGHRDEGGHGGDSDREREAWAIAWTTDGHRPDWPVEIEPHRLAGLALDARGGQELPRDDSNHRS